MNTRTKVMIITACTQMLVISAGILVIMADLWMDGGRGLNPWIAIPIATIFMGAPYILSDLLSYEEPEDIGLDATHEQLEREHFGDPDKKTGIYHPDHTDRRVFPAVKI